MIERVESMSKYLIKRLVACVSLLALLTGCTDLNGMEYIPTETTTTTTMETTITTTMDTELLIEFEDYTSTKNDDDSYNFTITQDATDDCYYTISLMYDDRITEYVSGDFYIKSAYGMFADEDTTMETTVPEEEEDSEEVTTTELDLESFLGKEGKWTFKTISEGTQYIEIKLINSYGDTVGKYQLTCIVDTHLEPHMYYTNINY
jgi:hypothetical protein